jgi:hypothetical protein
MATTYEIIASVTVGSGGAANIEFTSIPATYTDLELKLSLRTDFSNDDQAHRIEFNSSSSNFSYKSIRAYSSAQSANGSINFLSFGNGAGLTSSTFDSISVYIPNYAGSTNKSFSTDGVTETNASDVWRNLVAQLWSNTAAITSIKILPESGNFVQYSTAYLYGISNA